MNAQVPIPPALHGWDEWVLYGHEMHRCPWLVPGKPDDDSRVCAWPSPLELAVDEHGGRFSQHWQAPAETWLPLPGSSEYWPEEVTLNGAPAVLVLHEGSPAVHVAAGTHALAGLFRWARRPELLPLPARVALVSLTLDGTRIAGPQRNDAGVVLGTHAVARQDDRVDLKVFRLLDDDLPARLSTQLQLSVAGEAREIRLPAVLPAGFVPSSIEGELAARLDPDGTLRVQVRPGAFTLTLEARGPSPVTEVRLGPHESPWPPAEVWSFQSQDRLRVAAVEGVAAVDPGQADVPDEWSELPAYRMSPSTPLRVAERTRGLSSVDGNQLMLRRTAWLDFSGKGYTLVDRISGDMRQGWRLDMAAPYALRSAETASADALLITAGSDATLSGIELRTPSVDLTAVSRLPRQGGSLPATGWRTRLAGVSGALITAPGYRLLAALGPDSAPQAWLERWRLLDIFAVLLIATAAWRILGVQPALIALAAITLTYQESGAPTWLWLAVLLMLALQRAAPEGRLRQAAGACRVVALVLLVLALVPFAVTQARLAVYPQLEALELYTGSYALQPETQAKAAMVAEEYKPLDSAARKQLKGMLSARSAAAPASVQEVVVTGARRVSSMSYEPGAVVQAGPGLPSWRYHVYAYSWSGPVEENARVRFIISPPWLTRLWRLLGLALALLLLFELTGRKLPPLPGAWRSRAAVATGLLALGAALVTAPAARADTTPDSELLDELRGRLLAPPHCAPDCADLTSATVTATADRLTIVLSVSALDAVGVALPGADPAWVPEVVQVDGAQAGWVARSPRAIRYVSVGRGHHVVRMEGPIGALDALSLAFPLAPHVIDLSAPDWDAGGVSERHLVSGALQLARRRVAAAHTTFRQEEFPPFADIDRLFLLANDWKVATTVMRVAPKSAAFTVRVPLLPQESVTTPGLQASDGSVTVGLAVGQNSQQFSSILPRSDTLELLAASDAAHSEHWRFEVGSSWHADFSGVPAVAPRQDSGPWTFEYYPRPGERLRLAVTRPAAVAGSTLAFDQVRLETTVGKRSSDTHLVLSYRSTQGGRHTLELPADAVVTRVQSDGDPLALRPEHGALSLSALPGRHTWVVEWQSPRGAELVTRLPSVTQGAPASNLQLSLKLPADRWILYVMGPGIGPTILYWGELLIFVAAAWLLGRSGLTRLPTRDWLLLGLGLSTFSWLVLGLFVLFVAVFEWRARTAPPLQADRFRLLQVGSALLALVALAAVVAAVPKGLLAQPDMRIAPDAPDGVLSWFVDQSDQRLPSPGVLSVSLWWYKLAMLAWALWLSFALTHWVRWAWQVFTRDGLWRSGTPRARTAPAPPAAEPAP